MQVVYANRTIKWYFKLPLLLLAIILFQCSDQLVLCQNAEHTSKKYKDFSFVREELRSYRDQVKDLFNFGLDSYLQHGFPFDEVRPISCVPNTRNFNDPSDMPANDVLGNFTVTLFDSLTTVAVIGDRERMLQLVRLVEKMYKNFDIDSTVQVFETTIRILGSLLSTHLYITDPRKAVYLGDDYDGSSLLKLSVDLADRLLVAYKTRTGLPLPRINLRDKFKGLTHEMAKENNVAAIASPMFEFTVLSYLTGDRKYEKVTRYAFDKVWDMRTSHNLLPSSFNPDDRNCYSILTGIGASIDSFYEYALKGSVLFDDNELYKTWETAYSALKMYSRSDWFYNNIDSSTGAVITNWIDSLSAFFPGVQVLAGDLDDAVLKHIMSLKLWNTFGGIPERWRFEFLNKTSMDEETVKSLILPLEWYPLRPEFIESTYFLYRATKDPFYLNIGVRILRDFQTRFKGKCGFAGIQNIFEGIRQDRMETFALSETLKYLYLLFDEDNELHHTRDNIIFSTEAHPLWLRPEVISNYKLNGYFNDTDVKRHLEFCEANERKYRGGLRRSAMKGKKNLVGLARRLLNKSKGGSYEEEDRILSNTEAETNTCPRLHRFSSVHHSLFSPLLSNFTRLFEVDNIYRSTLLRPESLYSYSPIETEKQFYDRWLDPKQGLCQLTQTTESFILYLPSEGDEIISLPQFFSSNNTIYCKKFRGPKKIQLEKLQPGKIDTFGHLVSVDDILNNSDCKDTVNDDNSSAQSSVFCPSMVYRVTSFDGLDVPPDGRVLLNKMDLLLPDSETNVAGDVKWNFLYPNTGVNSRGQLLLESIPIVNMYVV